MKLDTATNGMLYITLNEDECDKLNFGIKDIDTLFSGHNTVICGSCNSICNGSDIFYVPGLNEVYCQDCFDDMQKGMTHYDDKMSIIKISQNKINVDNYVQELHKVKAVFLDKYTYGDMSASYHKATKNWGMAGMGSQRVHGINYMNVRGWMQEAGDGDFYGLHTENGQSVLVLAQGAGPWVSGVAWKTPQLAQQYKHKKFKDLYYQDDQ